MILRDLIEAATTPPAEDEQHGKNSGRWAAYDRARARLDRIMRDPATAVLLADMADLLGASITFDVEWESDAKTLLARFRDLESRA